MENVKAHFRHFIPLDNGVFICTSVRNISAHAHAHAHTDTRIYK